MAKIKKIAIFDMDGVLVDTSWAYKVLDCGKKINLAFWRENERGLFFSDLLPTAQTYRELLADPSVFVVIATARLCHSSDHAFVDMKLGRPDAFIYRKEKDGNMGGAALKIRGLKKLMNLKQFKSIVDFEVYEDNISYLKDIVNFLFESGKNAKGIYVPSNQGH